MAFELDPSKSEMNTRDFGKRFLRVFKNKNIEVVAEYTVASSEIKKHCVKTLYDVHLKIKQGDVSQMLNLIHVRGCSEE